MQVAMLEAGLGELQPQQAGEVAETEAAFMGTLDRALQEEAEPPAEVPIDPALMEAATPREPAAESIRPRGVDLLAGLQPVVAEPDGDPSLSETSNAASERPATRVPGRAELMIPEAPLETEAEITETTRTAVRAVDARAETPRGAVGPPAPATVELAVTEGSAPSVEAARATAPAATETGVAGFTAQDVPTRGRTAARTDGSSAPAVEAADQESSSASATDRLMQPAEPVEERSGSFDRGAGSRAPSIASREQPIAAESRQADPPPAEAASSLTPEQEAVSSPASLPTTPASVEHARVAPPVAESVSAASASLRPSSAAPPAQPVEMIPQHVELLASQGGGTARIRLNPPELGQVDISVAMRGSVVDVVIHAEEPAAQLAVLAHAEQLSDALATRELRMERFDVLSGQRGEAGDAENEQRAPGEGPETDLAGSQREARRESVLGSASRTATSEPETAMQSTLYGFDAGRSIDLRA